MLALEQRVMCVGNNRLGGGGGGGGGGELNTRGGPGRPKARFNFRGPFF